MTKVKGTRMAIAIVAERPGKRTDDGAEHHADQRQEQIEPRSVRR